MDRQQRADAFRVKTNGFGVAKSLAMMIIDDVNPAEVTEQACINYAIAKGYRKVDGQEAWVIIFREMRKV